MPIENDSLLLLCWVWAQSVEGSGPASGSLDDEVTHMAKLSPPRARRSHAMMPHESILVFPLVVQSDNDGVRE